MTSLFTKCNKVFRKMGIAVIQKHVYNLLLPLLHILKCVT